MTWLTPAKTFDIPKDTYLAGGKLKLYHLLWLHLLSQSLWHSETNLFDREKFKIGQSLLKPNVDSPKFTYMAEKSLIYKNWNWLNLWWLNLIQPKPLTFQNILTWLKVKLRPQDEVWSLKILVNWQRIYVCTKPLTFYDLKLEGNNISSALIWYNLNLRHR